MVTIMGFKIILSSIHVIKASFQKYKVYKLIKSKTSHVFDDVGVVPLHKNEDIFEVYYDEDGNDFRVPKDNLVIRKFLQHLISKSAIRSQYAYRGFELAELYDDH